MFEGASTGVLDSSGQVLLLWSDTRDCASQKELVDLLERYEDKAVIRSVHKVLENTQVYFIGDQCTGNGIVRSCRKDASSFILTVQIDQSSFSLMGSEPDPGILAVESFLTEEQEAEILRDLEIDAPYNTTFSASHDKT